MVMYLHLLLMIMYLHLLLMVMYLHLLLMVMYLHLLLMVMYLHLRHVLLWQNSVFLVNLIKGKMINSNDIIIILGTESRDMC